MLIYVIATYLDGLMYHVNRNFFPTIPEHEDNSHMPLHIYQSHGNHSDSVPWVFPHVYLVEAAETLKDYLHYFHYS